VRVQVTIRIIFRQLTANARPDNHRRPPAQFSRPFDGRVPHRFAGGDNRELRKAVKVPRMLRVEMIVRIEATHFCAVVKTQAAVVHRLHGRDGTAAFDQPCPGLPHIVPQRSDCAESGHDNAMVRHVLF
jgi:hypothetical protein